MSDTIESLSPPRRSAILWESRTALELARMMVPLLNARRLPPSARAGAHVMVVPGFGASDRSTAPLRHYLDRRGFHTEGWGLGKNMAGVDLPHELDDLSDGWVFAPKAEYCGEGSVPYLADRLMDRLRERHAEVGQPISLIGWSLGGYLAREAARDLPDIVDRVITMGSPTVGGPKYTAAAGFFRKRGMDLDWIEDGIEKRELRRISQPITAIYSKSDAIVSWEAAIDRYSDRVRHIEVDAPHLGMGFNPTVWSHVVAALEEEAR